MNRNSLLPPFQMLATAGKAQRHSKLSDYLKIRGLDDNCISLSDVMYCNHLKIHYFCEWISALHFSTYFASASLKK